MKKQATPMMRSIIPPMQKFRRENPAQHLRLSQCPICHGAAQSECCAVINNIVATTDLNRSQRSAAAKAVRAMMPKLNMVEFLFGVKKV